MIGITYSETMFDEYLKWLDHFNADYCVLDYRSSDAFSTFDKCKALILTGGIDIYPELFNDWDSKPDAVKYNPERDGFEFKILESAVCRNLPVLGICRGCQFINVYFNGSLIFDIESVRKVNHRALDDKKMRLHSVNVVEDSVLYNITGKKEGVVTSSHHQSVDRPGEGIRITSKSPDGIVESIEHSDKFILGVQWHPECLENFDDPFSKNLIMKFIELSR